VIGEEKNREIGSKDKVVKSIVEMER